MPPNDTKWLELAPNGSRSVKQVNKNAKRSHTVSKSLVIFKKSQKKHQKCKKMLKHVKKYQKVLKKSFYSQKKDTTTENA